MKAVKILLITFGAVALIMLLSIALTSCNTAKQAERIAKREERRNNKAMARILADRKLIDIVNERTGALYTPNDTVVKYIKGDTVVDLKEYFDTVIIHDTLNNIDTVIVTNTKVVNKYIKDTIIKTVTDNKLLDIEKAKTNQLLNDNLKLSNEYANQKDVIAKLKGTKTWLWIGVSFLALVIALLVYLLLKKK